MASNMRFDILVDLDAKAAAEHVDELRRRLEELGDKHVKAEIDDAEFKAQLREIKGELDALADKHPDVKVRASAARAIADLREVKAEARELDGKNVNVRVDDAGTTSLFTGNTRLLIAAGLAIGPAIAAGVAPGIAALAALGATAGAVAQGGVTLLAAFSGISKGVQELGHDELATAGKAEQSAAAQVSAANSIANAQDSLRAAVGDVAVAQENAALAVHRALEQEESAHLAVDQAVRREHDAELSLVDAQRSALRAQQDLTQARVEAQRSLEDLAFGVQDNALAQRRAQLDLEAAQKALANIDQSDPRRADAELTLAERQQRLTELQVQGQRLASDKASADAKGIEGSQQVTSAQDALTQANQRVVDSQQQIADSALAATQAQQRERDAVEEVTRARVNGDRQVTAARQSVIQAERGLQTALASQAAQAAATAASTGRLTKAMDDLSPAGQHFASFLHDDLIPGFKGVRDGVQASLLPDMELSLRLLAQDAPILTRGLQGTAAVIGDLSVRGAKMMTSGPWQADFALIMAANNRALQGWGNAGLSTLDVMRNLTAAAIPLELHFAGVAQKSLDTFAAWVQGKRDSGELGVWFHEMQERLSQIGHFLAQVAGGAWQLFQALSPLGGVTLQLIGDLAQFVGWVSQVNPGLVQTVAVVAALYPWVSRLGTAWQALSTLGPAAAGAISSVAINAGSLTERLGGSATASDRVTNAVSRAGTALPVLGAALIAVAASYENARQQGDEWAHTLMKGGAAAEEVTRQIQESDAEYDHWYNWIGKISRAFGVANPSLGETKQKIIDLRAEMDPLTRAQSLATEAQNNYITAVERFGPASAQASDAQGRYSSATQVVTHQQDLLKRGLDSTTDALKAQQEQVLDLSDADIRYGDALQRALDSIKEHHQTLDLNTDAGRRNQQALNDLVRAMQAQEDQMRNSGASEQLITATHEQHRLKLREVATQMGQNEQEAQRLTDRYLGIPREVTTTLLANTFPAFDAVNHLAGDIANALRAIPDESISVAFTAPGSVYGQTQALAQSIPRAMGGRIVGPGTDTSDSIPALLSNDEHVWTAREVKGAGGHGNVERLRSMAALGQIPALATGGPVNYSANLNLFGDLGNVVATNVDYVRAEIEKLKKTLAEAPPGPAGAGVARWAAMVDQALGIMGQPLAYEGITLRRMQQESGGNPTIVNRWDSNWAKGTPSVGLMQVIGPTYRANKVIDTGPYLYGVSVDPLANTLASMRYAIGRYGSLPAAYNRPGGYANGGIVTSPTLAHIAEGGAPEAIIPLTRPARAAAIMSQAGLGGATVNVGPVHVHSDVDVDVLAHRLAFSAASAGL